MSSETAKTHPAAPRLHFSVAPEPSRLLRARERIRDYLALYCPDETTVNDVVLAVEEACTNAIRHSGSDRDIEIRLRFKGNDLRATVNDSGRGFDVASFDPHKVPDPLLDHGRGLYLMSRLCDQMELSCDGGLEVRLVKRAVLRALPPLDQFDRLVVPDRRAAPGRDGRVRAMLAEIAEGFAAFDWEYRYTYVNPAACRLLEHSEAEILGRTPCDLWPEYSGHEVEGAYRAAMELGRSSIVEYETAGHHWFEERLYPTTQGLSVYFRNIDERKRKEFEHDELFERLGTSQAMLERSQQLAHLGSWELDLVTGRLAWSDEVYRIFGLEPQEFGATYEAFLERVHPDDRDAVDAAYSGSLREDRDTYEIEHRVVRKHSGEIRFVHERCDHLRNAAGKIVRSVGMVHDITERKLAEAALCESEARLRLASHGGEIGLYEWNATRDAPYWGSPEAYELFGLDPDAPVTFESWLACVHPDDREKLARTMAALRALDRSQPVPGAQRDEYRVIQRDGRVVWLEAVNTVTREGDDLVIRGGVRDITARKRAEALLAERTRLAEALNAINRLVHSTRDFDEIMQRSLDEGARALAADAGTIEIREQSSWVVGHQCGLAGTLVGLRQADVEAPNATQALVRREVFTTPDTRADGTDVGFMADNGLRSVMAVPLLSHDAVIGCLLFYGKKVRTPSEAELDFGRKLGSTVSLAVSNARLAQAEREASRLSAALNEINTLIHSTLEAEAIMRRIVHSAVAAVGSDSAMIALRHGEDWVAEYGHPELPGVIHESVRSDEAPFMMMAVSERRPIAIDDCETDPRCFPEVQRRFGVRSVLCVPLVARDEAIGVVFFNHHRAAVPFTPATVDFGAKLAVALISALENARLYQEQQRIALTLQESLLHPLPSVAGLELGVVTQPAYAPELVGGDFSDVFVLDDGQVGILIGDVAGKGVRAAGLTETVRSTVRAFAAIDPSPAFVLAKANDLLLRHDPDGPHVTAFYCLLDPRTGHLAYASAGHPAPIHLGPHRGRPLAVRFGPPLGSFERSYKGAHTTLSLDDYLVFYTDGVTEARRAGELYGEKRLTEALANLRGLSAQKLADDLVSEVGTYADRLADDIQVVTLRLA